MKQNIYFLLILICTPLIYAWEDYHKRKTCEEDDDCKRDGFICGDDGFCRHKDLHYILNWIIYVWLCCCCTAVIGFVYSEI